MNYVSAGVPGRACSLWGLFERTLSALSVPCLKRDLLIKQMISSYNEAVSHLQMEGDLRGLPRFTIVTGTGTESNKWNCCLLISSVCIYILTKRVSYSFFFIK